MAGARFAPSAFRWNGRVAVALLPSLIVLAGFGGTVPSGVMMVGAMVSSTAHAVCSLSATWLGRRRSRADLLAAEQVAYIMDAMRYREGTLGAVWITLGMANLGMLAAILLPAFSRSTPLLLAMLSSLCTGATLFLTGVRSQGCRPRPASPSGWACHNTACVWL